METFLTIELGTWMFLVIGAVFSGYAILDGFDLGAGTIHLFLKKEESRRIALNAIGPVWDGNEVWLVIGGGTLFAGFPKVYATLLSSFYIPFILFLVLLILRAIAIEFRSKEPMLWWRKLWDIVYSFSSTMIGFTLGVVLGNVVLGIAIDENMIYKGGLLDIFNPYALLTGLTVVALFALHGSVYLVMKTKDRLSDRLVNISKTAGMFFTICYVLLSIATLVYVPHAAEDFKETPILFGIPVVTLLLLLNERWLIEKKKYWLAFLSSATLTALLLVTIAIGLFPNILISNIDSAYSLTIDNSAASQKSLGIILTFVLIGAPLVLLYTLFLFRTFKGKVELDDMSY
ncbi:MAG: cytochrome d ubiquinol oxidase subunit II [Prolixibacteraceae bacterium]|nr:cytochrome d ubiquinol oxidase subunit II [Prolixibacteraceae bacterium]